MTSCRFSFFCILFTLLFSPFVTSEAAAAAYPARPVQVILPHPAGSVADITARMMTEEMEKSMGGKFVILNKPGAGTVLGADAAARAKKDGYTLFYGGASPLIYAPVANPKVVHYDPGKDFEPLAFHFFLPTVVAVKADAPWKTFGDFVDDAKKNPGKIRITSIGVGSSTHFSIEMLQLITGIKLTHVPYEGGETVITAVVGGHVEATLDGLQKVKPHMEAGRMRVLLIDPKKPNYPDIPTLRELGYNQGLRSTWFGLWAPSGIPDEARRVLVPAAEKAVKATKARVDQMGNVCEYKSPSELKKLWSDEYKEVSELAKKIGIGQP